MSDPNLTTQRQIQALQDKLERLRKADAILYASGSFVPTWVGTTIAGTFTYVAASCLVEWSRIEDRLLFSGRIEISAIGVAPTGNLTLAGFPYPGEADASMLIAGGGALIVWQLNISAGYTQVAMQMVDGSSAMTIMRSGDNVAPGAVQGGELIVGNCWFMGQYRVA
jgi:hypothetical protein